MSWFRKRGEKTEHRYVAERLSAYMDGELSSKEHAIVEYHLDICQDCRWNLETLRQTVKWTRELPTVPIPHVFTIPVDAPPVRAPRRAWVAPLLQGATALVALLLVFVVAGDYLLTGSRPTWTPEPQVVVEGAPTEVVTIALEAEELVPAEIEEEAVVEAPAVEAEKVALSPTSSPAPTQPVFQAATPTEAAAGVAEVEAEAEVTFTATPSNAGMGVTGFETPAEVTKEFTDASATVTAPSAPSPVPTVTETATSEPTPTTLPTETPTLAASVEPTIVSVTFVAEAPAEAAVGAGEQEQTLPAAQQEPLVLWLGVTEIALLVVLILLGTITIVVMLRQRRIG